MLMVGSMQLFTRLAELVQVAGQADVGGLVLVQARAAADPRRSDWPTTCVSMTVDPRTFVQLPVYDHDARVLSLECSPAYLVS